MELREGMLLMAVVFAGLCSVGRSASECNVNHSDPCYCRAGSVSINIGSVFPSRIKYLTSGNDTYIYSPCKSIPPNLSSSTNTPALVWDLRKEKEKEKEKTVAIAIGREGNITWLINSIHPLEFQITYTGGDPYEDKPRNSIFYFKYTPNKTEMIYQKKKGHSFMFLVTGNSVKANTSTMGSKVAVGVIGLVIISLILVAIVTYCVVGVVYNYKVKGQRGSALIPNSGFWREFPLLVKDGCLFTFSPCTSRFRGDYQEL